MVRSSKLDAIYVDDLYDDNVALRAENERLERLLRRESESLEKALAEVARLRAVEAAASNLDMHRNSGYASVVSYMIRLHEALWGEALKAPDLEPDRHPET